MTPRPATVEDVPAVAALEHALFGADAWSAAATREELTGPGRRAVVSCTESGRVVGYAVTRVAGDTADLHRIAVSPERRRAGLGRSLLAAVRDAAADDGARRLLLEVSADNDAARRFYAAEGFVEIDRRRRYYRDGSDALVLEAAVLTAQGRGSR